jgi:hypothetical protein
VTVLGRLGTAGSPLWWRLPMWAAITFATVAATPGTESRVRAGVPALKR